MLRVLFLFFCTQLWAAPCPQPSCQAETASWLLGVTLNQVMPNSATQVDVPALTLGPLFGLPVGPGSLILKLNYGATTSTTLALGQLGYRLKIQNPFLRFFAEGGGYGMSYNPFTAFNPSYGPYIGYGMAFPASDKLMVSLGMELLIQTRSLIGVFANIIW